MFKIWCAKQFCELFMHITEDLYANLSFANKSDFLAWFKNFGLCSEIEYS